MRFLACHCFQCVLTFLCASSLASLYASSFACVLPAFVDTCSTLGPSRSSTPQIAVAPKARGALAIGHWLSSAGPLLQGPLVQVCRSALSGARALRHSGIYGRSRSAAAALLGALRARRSAALAMDRPGARSGARRSLALAWASLARVSPWHFRRSAISVALALGLMLLCILLYECWLVAVCSFFCLFADSHVCRAWLHECLCVCFVVFSLLVSFAFSALVCEQAPNQSVSINGMLRPSATPVLGRSGASIGPFPAIGRPGAQSPQCSTHVSHVSSHMGHICFSRSFTPAPPPSLVSKMSDGKSSPVACHYL